MATVKILPERTFDKSRFSSEVKLVHDRLGRCLIALSEGIRDADGTPLSVKLAATVEKDAHVNVQLPGAAALADLLGEAIRCELRIKRVRGDMFGYLQRSLPAAHRTWVGGKRARSTNLLSSRRFGDRHRLDGDPAHRRLCRRFRSGESGKVADKTKVMVNAFIAPSGNDVAPAFREYLRPLLGGGLPQLARLRGSAIAKVLNRQDAL